MPPYTLRHSHMLTTLLTTGRLAWNNAKTTNKTKQPVQKNPAASSSKSRQDTREKAGLVCERAFFQHLPPSLQFNTLHSSNSKVRLLLNIREVVASLLSRRLERTGSSATTEQLSSVCGSFVCLECESSTPSSSSGIIIRYHTPF
mmetsp:Transcript_9001/g.18073  ORF Transcript_9001/g.18073 Transcript_9001/m.18073 type:complete len:145 (+) Transcript_9001:97-531(+)